MERVATNNATGTKGVRAPHRPIRMNAKTDGSFLQTKVSQGCVEFLRDWAYLEMDGGT